MMRVDLSWGIEYEYKRSKLKMLYVLDWLRFLFEAFSGMCSGLYKLYQAGRMPDFSNMRDVRFAN